MDVNILRLHSYLDIKKKHYLLIYKFNTFRNTLTLLKFKDSSFSSCKTSKTCQMYIFENTRWLNPHGTSHNNTNVMRCTHQEAEVA